MKAKKKNAVSRVLPSVAVAEAALKKEEAAAKAAKERSKLAKGKLKHARKAAKNAKRAAKHAAKLATKARKALQNVRRGAKISHPKQAKAQRRKKPSVSKSTVRQKRLPAKPAKKSRPAPPLNAATTASEPAPVVTTSPAPIAGSVTEVPRTESNEATAG